MITIQHKHGYPEMYSMKQSTEGTMDKNLKLTEGKWESLAHSKNKNSK